MKRIKNSTGYPSKKYIRHLVDKYNLALAPYDMKVNPKCVTFSATFGETGKRTGILWKDTSSMEAMDGFDTYLMEHGLKVSRVKYWGVIHSIWFDCELSEK